MISKFSVPMHPAKLAVGRAILRSVNDSAKRQLVQIEALKGEVKDNVERVQEYGFTSVPLPGAQAVFVCVGGNRDHPVVIAADDPRHRVKGLKSGEVAIYTDEGDTILLKRGNEIEITTTKLTVKAAEAVRMETPILEVTGHIIDQAGSGGFSMAAMRSIYNGHTHTETQGTTNPPNEQMS